MENYAELMFTDEVKILQDLAGTREKYEKFYPHRTNPQLTEDDRAFISARDSFYIASVNTDGWPYIQHRGGPLGFLKIIGPTTLACADYQGNQQFISMGNLKTDDKVSLFFMDYLNHARLKVQGHASLVPVSDADPDLVARFSTDPTPERVLTIEVVAVDWNCPKYIPTLYPEAAIRQVIAPQIEKLRSENEALRAELARF